MLFRSDTVHYEAIIVQNIGGLLNSEKLKTKISNFNSANYSEKQLTIDEFMLDHRFKILVIRQFANKQEAMSYHDHLFDNDSVYGDVSPDNYKQFAISANNLPEVLKQKKADDYENFFRSFYK